VSHQHTEPDDDGAARSAPAASARSIDTERKEASDAEHDRPIGQDETPAGKAKTPQRVAQA
jgi:hypothetical protein